MENIISKNEAFEMVAEAIQAHGFMGGCGSPSDEMPVISFSEDSYINIYISAEWDFDDEDLKNKMVKTRVTANAHISKMNSNSSPDELLRAADEISRAARLVEFINSLNIVYIKHF